MARNSFLKTACLALAFSLLAAVPCQAARDSDGERAVQAVAETLNTDVGGILSTEALTPGESIPDWLAFSMGRAGLGGGTYLARLEEEVTERYRKEGGLSDKRATEWQRVALTVMALGGDPTSFGTDGDGGKINLVREGTYGWDRTDSFDIQGLNAWIFALLTLDAEDFEIPEDANFTREGILAHIIDAQDASGGFGLSGGASVDITAMALQALAPYRDNEAKGAINRALEYLSAAQDSQGSFGGCSESTAQVIIALCCLEIDPDADPRFCKEGGSAVDGLRLFRLPSGLYCHTMDGVDDLFATKEAILAWVALDRRNGGYRTLFDMRGETGNPAQPLYNLSDGPGVGPVLLAVFLILALAAAAYFIIRKKGKKKQHG